MTSYVDVLSHDLGNEDLSFVGPEEDRSEWSFGRASVPSIVPVKPVRGGVLLDVAIRDGGGPDVAGDITTTATVSDGQTIIGEISSLSDEDWYAVDLLAGQTIELLQADTDDEPHIFFQNPDGSSNLTYSTLFIFETSQVGASLTADSDGTYFVNVSPGSAEVASYSIDARIFTDDAGDDSSTERMIAVGETISGQINFDGDQDWYAIELLADQGILVEVVATDEQAEGVSLTIESPDIISDGAQIVTNSSARHAYGASVAGTHYISTTLGEGGYTLSVSSIADDYGIEPETRGTLLRDTVTFGELNFRGDQDEFTFDGVSGEVIVFGVVLSSDNGFTFPDPSLVGPDGATLTPGFVSDPVQEAAYVNRPPTEILIFELPETGSYTFNLSGGMNGQVTPVDYSILAFEIPERIIPGALEFIFPDGAIAWAPLPTIGDTPVAPPTNSTINLRENFDGGSLVDETFYRVAEGEELYNNSGNAIFFTETGATIENFGTIWVEDGSIGTTSQPIGGSDLNLVTNHGSIVALNAAGSATGIRSNNNGLLKNHGDLIVVADGGPAVGYTVFNPTNFDISTGISDDYTVENSGTISVWAGDRDNSNVSFATGLYLGTDQNINGDSAPNVLNSGLIEAVGITRAAAISADEGGIIHNSGTIFANSLTEEFAIGISVLGGISLDVQNSGVIDAVYAIVFIDSTGGNIPNNDDIGRVPTIIDNTGSIFGDIVLVGSVDSITNDGTIEGAIELRDGDDVYTSSAKGVLSGLVDLGDGDDLGVGGDFGEVMIGGAGADRLEGNGGADLLIADNMSLSEVDSLLLSLGL